MLGNPSGQALFLGEPPAVIYKSGDSVPNLPNVLLGQPASSTTVHAAHYTPDGSRHLVGVHTKPQSNPRWALILDGEGLLLDGLLAAEGVVLPPSMQVSGNEKWSALIARGIAADGTYLFTGVTTAASSQNEVVVLDGELLQREGGVVDGLSLQSSLEGADLSDRADLVVAWRVDDPVLLPNPKTLFFNGRAVLQEGDAVDLDGDGAPDPDWTLHEIFKDTARLANDRSVYLRAEIENGPDERYAVLRLPIRDLELDTSSLSVAAGGTATLNVFAPRDAGAELYLLLASLSGTDPGIALDGFTLPLNPDPLFNLTLNQPNSSFLSGSFGVLDTLHTAEAQFVLPPGLNASLVGQTVSFAYVALGTSPALFVASVSNAVGVLLAP